MIKTKNPFGDETINKEEELLKLLEAIEQKRDQINKV